MNRKLPILFAIFFAPWPSPTPAAPADPAPPPNVVIIFADDQGYADVGVYGAEGFKTPNLDSLAEKGMRFTDFYVACPVCSGSRVALLTGCYPRRVGLPGVLGPSSNIGLNPDETTLAELLKAKGYATAVYGKWHLGHHEKFLPTHQGFDDYFGLPYSNDMWPFHPTAGANYPPLPLIEKTKTIYLNPDQTQLTTWYTQHAVQFIEDHKDHPFFLYLPHSMPHVPLFVSEKYKAKTDRGLYGDVISEIDWSVGRILAALDKHHLADNTLVIYTSDNGPWLSYGTHAGSAKPLREGKATTFEGGMRVPAIFRYPKTIPAGAVCRQPAMTIDLLPTIADLTGVPLPKHKIDGKTIAPLLRNEPNAQSPHDALFFYAGHGELQAVRSGNWKLHFPHSYRTLNDRPGGTKGLPAKYDNADIELALFDLSVDVGETINLADRHPEIVKRLSAYADRIRAEIGDVAGKQNGTEVRPAGKL